MFVLVALQQDGIVLCEVLAGYLSGSAFAPATFVLYLCAQATPTARAEDACATAYWFQNYRVLGHRFTERIPPHSAAKDHEGEMLVAIKKIENLFEYKTFTKRTLREIRILRMLVGWGYFHSSEFSFDSLKSHERAPTGPRKHYSTAINHDATQSQHV